MGKGQSKAATLEAFTEWERDAVDALIQRYKDEDLSIRLNGETMHHTPCGRGPREKVL